MALVRFLKSQNWRRGKAEKGTVTINNTIINFLVAQAERLLIIRFTNY